MNLYTHSSEGLEEDQEVQDVSSVNTTGQQDKLGIERNDSAALI